jgi:23S rRNA (cytosine1962-C5)-methyltransferase
MPANSSDQPLLQLNRQEDRRLRAGHVWVYSNEVDIKATPLKEFEPGSLVTVVSATGKPLGSAYVNPHTLICARLISRDPAVMLDKSLLVHRLNMALSLRERLFAQPYYRLVYGEADQLPGLIVDRYGDVLVVQITTAGMERVREDLLTALRQVFPAAVILWRNDSPSRETEGLSLYVEDAHGQVPEQIEIEENGTHFLVDPRHGQKTGWFYDQRFNRARVQQYARGRRVLDVFSYTGSFGLQAAVAGAEQVTCIDSSARALDSLQTNAALNDVSDRIQVIEADAFAALKELRNEGRQFDVVLVDPPAFIKRKKDIKTGTEAYSRINQLAMRLLAKDGILVSSSCSYHLQETALQQLLLKNAVHMDRELAILERGWQGPDHPVHPAIPEMVYLKTLFCRLLPRR